MPLNEDKTLFYAMVEAERHPRSGPVVLWLGLGYQACTEGKVFKVGGLQASWGPLLGNASQQ